MRQGQEGVHRFGMFSPEMGLPPLVALAGEADHLFAGPGVDLGVFPVLHLGVEETRFVVFAAVLPEKAVGHVQGTFGVFDGTAQNAIM